MRTDHDIMRLPDPPPPAPDARAAAVQQALLRFDQKSAESGQGMPTDIRLIERTAAPLRRSRERSVMNRTRYLLAASLACIVAGSGAYLHLMRSPQPKRRRCARRTAGGSATTSLKLLRRCKQRRKAKARPSRKRKSKPPLRPESPTRKLPRLRLRRRRLPPGRTSKIRSPSRSAPMASPATAPDGSNGPVQRTSPLPSARSRYCEPDRSQPHARVAVGICAAVAQAEVLRDHDQREHVPGCVRACRPRPVCECAGKRLQGRARCAGLDILHRCRYGVVRVRPRTAQPQCAAAGRVRSDRGADQLLSLCL